MGSYASGVVYGEVFVESFARGAEHREFGKGRIKLYINLDTRRIARKHSLSWFEDFISVSRLLRRAFPRLD